MGLNSSLAKRDDYTSELAAPLSVAKRRVAEAYVRNCDCNPKKTAALLDLSERTVRDYLLDPTVKIYVDELLDRAGFKLKAIRNDLLRVMRSIAMTTIADVEIDPDAALSLQLQALPRRVQRSIRKLTIKTRTYETHTERTCDIEMHDPIRASEILGKWFGYEVEARREAEAPRDATAPLQHVGVNILPPKQITAEVIDIEPDPFDF